MSPYCRDTDFIKTSYPPPPRNEKYLQLQLFLNLLLCAKTLLLLLLLLFQFYRLLGLRVALVGAEVWNNGNRVSTDGTAKEILQRFLEWRQKDLLPRIPHDNVQLIV